MPENLPRFLTAENAENPISRSPFQRFRFKNYPRNRPMSPFYDSLAGGHFPETAIQAVRIASHDEAFASPSVDGGFRDVESLRYLSGREQTVAAQSFVAAGKFVCGANEGDFLQVEGFVFPSPKTALIEDLGDFTITVLIE